jgi:RHS repeat-associated protein
MKTRLLSPALFVVLLFLTSFSAYAQPGPNPQVPQGGTASFYYTGNNAPFSGGTGWQILFAGTTMGTTSQPHGWSASFDYATYKFTVSAPVQASVAANYEIRYRPSSGALMNVSALFDVVSNIPQLSSLTLNPATVVGGCASMGTVTITRAAPAGGVVVSLASSNTAAATVPASVTIATGASTANFIITSKAAASVAYTYISASFGNVKKTVPLVVEPGVLLNPTADAYVRAGAYADTNFGSQPLLIVQKLAANSSNDSNYASYLKFDLTALHKAPASAVLQLTIDPASTPATGIETVKCYAVANTSWTEAGITENNAPGLNRAGFTGIGTALTSQAVSLKPGVVTFNLTGYISAHLGQVVTLQLIDEATDNLLLAMESKEAGSGKPILALMYPVALADLPLPAWAEDVVPTDSSPTDGMGPSSADLVNLASGVEENRPGADIAARNPVGPTPVYSRLYRTTRASQGYRSPGLAVGWVDNYDISVQGPAQTGTWAPLSLTYPNGATETWTPVLNAAGAPTGMLLPPSGTPYLVSGVPSTTQGRWQSLSLTFGDESVWTFTPDSNHPGSYLLLRIANRIGHYITINRSAANGNRIGTVTDDSAPVNTLLSFTYNSNGYLSRVTEYSDPANPRQIAYTFSQAAGTTCLTAVSQIANSGDPFATQWAYGYTAINGSPFLNSVGVPDPTGAPGIRSHPINYDGGGRVASLVDANNNRRAYTYLGPTTQVQVQDPAGNIVEAWTQNIGANNVDTGSMDANNNIESAAYTDPANPLEPTVVTNKNHQSATLTYDGFGNVLTATDPRGVRTVYTFDYSDFALGRLVKVQVANRAPTTFVYYAANETVNGVLQPRGMLKTVFSPQPGSTGSGTQVRTDYTYTALGNPATFTQPAPNNSGGTVTYRYSYPFQAEALGEIGALTDPLNHAVFHHAYNARGNISASFSPYGWQTDYTYNVADQVLTVQPPSTGEFGPGRVTHTSAYLYPGGPLQSVTLFSETGVQVRQVIQTGGNEDELKAESGSVQQASYAYDAQSRLSQLKDGNNNAFQHKYDNVGNLTQFTYPLGDKLQGAYDPNSNLLKRTDGRSRITQYTYAADDDRLTDVGYNANSTLNVHYDHDIYGRVTLLRDGAGTTAYTYDENDAILSVTTTYTGLPPQTISYAYYPDGHRATMTTPAGTFRYTYDLAGRITDVQCPWTGGDLHYEYDVDGNLSYQGMHQVNANGNPYLYNTTYEFNPRGLLAQLTNYPYSGTQPVITSRFNSFQHDAVGNILYMNGGSTGAYNAPSSYDVQAYSYDNKDHLINENRVAIFYRYNYNFASDAADNLTTLRNAPLTYNANNQLANNIYDGDGNPTLYQGANLTFDEEDQLTAFNFIFAAGYREDGLRAWKQTSNGKTYFLYDGSTLLCELDPIGRVTAVHGVGAVGLAQIYYPMRATPAYCAFTFDPFGNVVSRHWQDSQNNFIDDLAVYDAFGGQIAERDVRTNQDYQPIDPVGYGGQWGNYTDRETGLVLMGLRYYDPATGRFLTRDPIGYEGGLNVYAYVQNNPINHIDPMGLDDGDDILPSHTDTTHAFKTTYPKALPTIHAGAQAGIKILKVGASINPIPLAIEAGSGKAAWDGHHLSPLVRGLAIVALAASVEGSLSKSASSLTRKQKGDLGEAEVLKELLEEGHEFIASQVAVRLDNGHLRVIDHVIRLKDTGKLVAIEVKTGTHGREAAQVINDVRLRKTGGIFVGKNKAAAAKAFGSKYMPPVPTIVRHYKIE